MPIRVDLPPQSTIPPAFVDLSSLLGFRATVYNPYKASTLAPVEIEDLTPTCKGHVIGRVRAFEDCNGEPQASAGRVFTVEGNSSEAEWRFHAANGVQRSVQLGDEVIHTGIVPTTVFGQVGRWRSPPGEWSPRRRHGVRPCYDLALVRPRESAERSTILDASAHKSQLRTAMDQFQARGL